MLLYVQSISSTAASSGQSLILGLAIGGGGALLVTILVIVGIYNYCST